MKIKRNRNTRLNRQKQSGETLQPLDLLYGPLFFLGHICKCSYVTEIQYNNRARHFKTF